MNIEKAMLRAIHDHGLVKAGDRILIGVSGGKDSLALSWLLARMAGRAAREDGRAAGNGPGIALCALKVIIGPDVPEGVYDHPAPRAAERPPAPAVEALGGSPDETVDVSLSRLFAAWNIPLRYYGVRASLDQSGQTLHQGADTGSIEQINGCYRCSALRREALAKYACKEGFTSIALGHHLDDILTTALMNLVSHGSAPAMHPSRNYDVLGLRLIRPLAYVPEESIRRLAVAQGWGRLTCTCPAGTQGDRAEFRRRLEVLCGEGLPAKLKLLKGLGIA